MFASFMKFQNFIRWVGRQSFKINFEVQSCFCFSLKNLSSILSKNLTYQPWSLICHLLQCFQTSLRSESAWQWKYLLLRRKFNFNCNMLIILTFAGSTSRMLREHLWSPEQWLGTTDLQYIIEKCEIWDWFHQLCMVNILNFDFSGKIA